MTDAEIIKAWECIAYHKECSESEECPYYMDNCNMCDNISLAKDVLDIYNRQKATIEKCADTLCKKEDTTQLIAKERQQYYDELQVAKAENERLRTANDKLGSVLIGFMDEVSKWESKHGLDVSELPLIAIRGEAKEAVDKIKVEAINEFAERLADEAYDNDLYDRGSNPINAIPINILLQVKKEMIGDNNAE